MRVLPVIVQRLVIKAREEEVLLTESCQADMSQHIRILLHRLKKDAVAVSCHLCQLSATEDVGDDLSMKRHLNFSFNNTDIVLISN